MKNYIAVIKTTEGSEMFNFTSDEDRQEFINICKKMDSYQAYAIATTERKVKLIIHIGNIIKKKLLYISANITT